MRNPMFAGLFLALACGSAGAASFTTLDDAQFGYLTALSRNGRIATGSFTAGGMFSGAFTWRKNSGVDSLALGSGMGMTSWAQPIVGSHDDGTGQTVAALAYSDIETRGPVLVGPYPGSHSIDNFLSQAYAVSDNGIVVGLAYDSTPNPIAFRWSENEGMSRLAVLRPDTFSRANAISTDGNTIAGWNDQETGYRQGVIWIEGKPVEPHNPGIYGDAFGSPPGEGLAVNANGSVVVGLGYFDDLMQSQAWRWTAATDAQPIGIILPPPARPEIARVLARLPPMSSAFADHRYSPTGFFTMPQSNAVSVSADGNTIVGNTGDGMTMQAFIWTPASGMVLMSDYAAAQGVDVPEGFYFLSANALSFDKKTIGGIGIDPTGTYIVSWVMDLHEASTRDTVVVAEGAVTSNDLVDGPFAGFPVGSGVSMTFHIASSGDSISPGRESAYALDNESFQLSVRYQDPNDFSHHLATDTLAVGGTPMLHLVNDNPRRDAIELAPTPTATAGQTLALSLSNPDGVLFDSDEATLINRSFGAGMFEGGSWVVSDGTHVMNISLQWITIKDDVDADAIFGDGFDGG
jgi:probable HAF family extracellular repeat protein